MDQQAKISNPWAEFKKDVSIAWKIFKENFKVYLGFELFVLLSSFAVVIISIIIFILLAFSISLVIPFEPSPVFFFSMGMLATVPNFVIVIILSGCIYGLNYDLISSGDEYTEIKNAFWYFNRYWWQYLIIGCLQGIVTLIWSARESINRITQFDPNANTFALYGSLEDLVILFIIMLCAQIIYWLLALMMPSVTATGKVLDSFRENFVIFRTEWKRIGYLFIFTFFIASVPTIITTFFLFNQQYVENTPPILLILYALFTIINILVISPMMSIVLTRVYNTSEIGKAHLADREKERKSIGVKPLW